VPRVLVIHRDVAEAAERAARLRSSDLEAEPYTALGSKGLRFLRVSPPDAIVIDLTRLPSYGKYMGALIREQKSLRTIPLVFIQGDPDKVAQVRAMLPDATYATWAKAAPAIRKAIARPPAEPVTPIAPHTPLLAKLGVRDDSRIALLHAPKEFRLPDGTWRRAQPAAADVVVAFYHSAAALDRELPTLAGLMQKGRKLWIAWPKKSAAAPGDLAMLRIQAMIEPYGLTQYKICAIDPKWAGMVLGIRRAVRREFL
jgi:hypothetical protein